MKVKRRPRRGRALLTASIGATMLMSCESVFTSGNLLPPSEAGAIGGETAGTSAGTSAGTNAGDIAGEEIGGAGDFISGNLLPPAGIEEEDLAGEPIIYDTGVAGESASPDAGVTGGPVDPDAGAAGTDG